MPITDWPKQDRPREKLLERGEQALTDAELIAIFLKTGVRGRTALDIAKALLVQFGSLNKLLQAPASLLTQTNGIGHSKYATLKAAQEMGRRCQEEPLAIGETLSSSTATQRFLAARLREQTHEVFACLFLDTHLRLIHYQVLFHGTLNETSIYPREIARHALKHNAAKLILAHNHPSGLPTPSSADKDVTQRIQHALALIDVRVIDHIIVGNPQNFSFADAGLI
ncbi:MAG: hypothetical protein A3E85_04740 [Gammaproteobacteria bacterium RIFCSPHIGHO2_12_FULL_45_12]|nr:MAG: hypothetical protein A3E85_04740 [Gammaproteobacteria bacterium RIFCSPHIGHO2_12_FULL_45_12]